MKKGVLLLVVVLVIAVMAGGCSTQKSKSIAACWRSNATGDILMRLNDDGSGAILAKYSADRLESFNLSWQKIADVVQVSVSKDKPEYQLPFEGNYLRYDEEEDLLCISESTVCFTRVTC
jgi:hypothetical protein